MVVVREGDFSFYKGIATVLIMLFASNIGAQVEGELYVSGGRIPVVKVGE